jgi:hypothetical protein
MFKQNFFLTHFKFIENFLNKIILKYHFYFKSYYQKLNFFKYFDFYFLHSDFNFDFDLFH